MSLYKVIDPTREKEEQLNKKVIKERPKPEIIVSESLEKSIQIISKFDYKFTNENHKIEYKTCFFCKNQFPTIKGRNYNCQNCEKIFCVKHRNILNHQCEKINPNLQRYLAAKNLIKEKKRIKRMMGK